VALQISYKKQFILMIMLLLVILVTVEVLVNIWLYYFYTCAFEKNEIFQDVNPEINRKVCIESLAYGFTQEKISWEEGTRILEKFGGFDENLVYINSHGFRGPEFTKIKSEDTIRIFVLGGSTTFGIGVLDNQTYPYYLQTMFDKSKLNFKVEVINSGWPDMWSLTETEVIKDKWILFEPDLFLVYDGWNEMNQQYSKNDPLASPILFKERWKEICEMGKLHDYSTIITLQPFVHTGKKILTDQEYEHYILIEKYQPYNLNYPEYIKQLDELKNYCNATADLRGIFDDITEPIYFDMAHTGKLGNQIIAEKFYQLALPLVVKPMESPDFNLDYDVVRETNTRLISNDYDVFLEEFYLTLRDLLSNYKTPRVFPLIFGK